MEIKDFFEQGLAHDLIMTERHYFVYRTIGEHAPLINDAPKSEERSILNYMQGPAMDTTIISLSKIYDKKNRNKKYKVRSLESLMDLKDRMNASFPYSLEYFDIFYKLEELAEMPFGRKAISNKNELFDYFKTILESDLVKSKVDHLKIVRDKYIVHNEHLETVPDIPNFWDEVAFLHDIGKLICAIVGQVFLETEYINLNEVGPNRVHYSIIFDFHWLISLIERVVGKDNMIIWWES